MAVRAEAKIYSNVRNSTWGRNVLVAFIYSVTIYCARPSKPIGNRPVLKLIEGAL
jgi:hypothetical protein